MKTALLVSLFYLLSVGMYAQRITGQVDMSASGEANRTLSVLPEGLIFYEGFDNVPIPQLPTGWSTFSLGDDGFQSGTSGNELGQANAGDFWPVPLHGLFAMSNDDVCNCDKSNDRLTSPAIDLTDRTFIRLGFSAFQNGSSGQSAYVQIRSANQPWTWVLDIPSSALWEEYSFTIPDHYLESGFQFRFRYDDNDAYASGLALDDIFLSDEPTGLFSLEGFFTIDGNEAASGYLYNSIPQTQAHYADLQFGALAHNGSVLRKNARLGVNISGPVTYEDTSLHWMAEPLTNLNVMFAPRQVFTPYALGDYELSASILTDSLDGSTDDNHFSTAFSVHDSIYSRVDEEGDGTGILLVAQNERAGMVYNVFEEDTVVSAWVSIHPASDSGARFRIKIFDFNTLTSSIFSSSPPTVIKKADLGNEIRVELNEPLPPGKYLFVIEKESSNGIIIINTTAKRKAPAGICLFQRPGANWEHLAYYPFLRLVFPAVDENCPGHIQSNVSDETCADLDDGSISLTLVGAPLPYTYTWSTGAGNVSSIAGLSPGEYHVTVEDGNSCTYERTFSIAEADTIAIDPDIALDSCAQGVGKVALNVSGVAAPYSILWNGSDYPEFRTGLSSGNYAIHLEDREGCTLDSTLSVGGTAALNVVISTNPSGCGASNGLLVASAFGTGPFSFEWNNGALTDSVTGVNSGIYNVTVADSVGCTTTVTALLNDSNSSVLTIQSKQDIICHGSASGSAVLGAAGGSTPLTYQWSNSATTPAITELEAGTYEVTVIDNNGCRSHSAVSIENESSPLLIDLLERGIDCHGTMSGAVQALVSGGNSPYTYAWSTGASTNEINGLDVGTYSLTLTDNSDCEQTVSTGMTTRPLFIYTVDSVFVDTIDSVSIGSSVFLSTYGGTPPYSYEWNNGHTREDLIEVDTGFYTLALRDQLGCLLNYERFLGKYPLQVREISLSQNLHIFPNPARPGALIHVEYYEPIAHIKLMDMAGRLLQEGPVISNGFTLNAFITGIYIIEARSDSGRLIRQRMVVSP